jgi:probable phosphoglycerate mutase
MKAIGIKRAIRQEGAEKPEVASKEARYPGPGVFLIRHANTALNSPDPGKEKIRGHLNPPLDASGVQQSKEIANHASATIRPEVVLSSDLQRATHTADQIAQTANTEAFKSSTFRPWDLGELQGKPAEAAASVIADHSKAENRNKDVPGGESFNDFSSRFLGGLEKVMQHVEDTGQCIAIVTHYRDLKLAQAWMDADRKGFDEKTFATNDTPTGSIMRIFPKGKDWDYEMLKEVPGAAEGKGAENKTAGNGSAGGRAV